MKSTRYKNIKACQKINKFKNRKIQVTLKNDKFYLIKIAIKVIRRKLNFKLGSRIRYTMIFGPKRVLKKTKIHSILLRYRYDLYFIFLFKIFFGFVPYLKTCTEPLDVKQVV
jgi:hypothetical protein